jgi:integrase
LPHALAVRLVEHKLASRYSGPSDHVLTTRTGRPLGHRNVLRELRRAERTAIDPNGRPMFPVLHEGRTVERGSVPNFHSFRHTAASEAIAAGDGAEEVSYQLGHKDSNVTRGIYVQEIKSAAPPDGSDSKRATARCST